MRGINRMKNYRKQYPAKTSVNLLYKKKTNISPAQALLAAVVFVVVLVSFAKFAVIDRLAVAAEAMQEAEELERTLADVMQSNSDYEDILREYQHYYFSAADGENGESGEDGGAGAYVNCLEVLKLLEAEVLNKAGIQMISLTGNALTVNLSEINLERASVIAKNLAEHETVKDVMVSAANKESQETTVYLNIVLKTEREKEKEKEAEKDNATEQNVDAEGDE